MELYEVNSEEENFIDQFNDKYRAKSPQENSIIFIHKRRRKLTDIPFILYIVLFTFLAFIISLIIYSIMKSKYKITYTYEENAYTKPKYSSHNYSSITFENDLKLVLVQVDSDDKAGAAISFDYGYLDNKFNPGYYELAFISLINYEVQNSDLLTYYFGKFDWDVEKCYSSFYFNILGGGFQRYLKIFSELTYLKDNDERFNNISDKDLTSSIYRDERKNHLLEYLIYGYKNSSEDDIIPKSYKDIKDGLKGNYSSIENIMRIILNNPSKIKIVLFSHYKMSFMKKIFLRYFSEIIHKPKIINNNLNPINAYNLSDFTTKKIIYYLLDDNDIENNFIEINYFLTNENITYNQLIKDSNYLLYIIYVLNQTNEGSLYYELNNAYDDINIKSLISEYEIILKSKIKFSIKVELNHYSYKYISEIISKVYNYMNNIKLYINYYNKTLNDIRIEELQIITEQIFTFTEDAHDIIFYKNMAIDLFKKDEKNYFLKKSWFSKENFIEEINKVNYYFNQLIINNSVIIVGINNDTIEKYNLFDSDIAYLFDDVYETKFFYLIYSLYNIDGNVNIFYDNNYTILLNPKKNEFISKYDYNSYLEYNSSDYENFFNTTFEEISESSDNYLKVFYKKDTSFRIPKVCITIYLFHPFLRPNFDKKSNNGDLFNKNDQLFFEYLLYLAYIKRSVAELLSDAFRAGGELSKFFFDEKFGSIEFFIYSDTVQKILNIINDIINSKINQTDFKSEIKKRFEIYKDIVFQDLLYDCSYRSKLEKAFYEEITEDKNNNLPPIYNFCNFPKQAFLNMSLGEIEIDEILSDIYGIKYIYIYGYFNKTETSEIYKLFNSTNNFDVPLKNYANFNGTIINVSNYVDWVIEIPLIKNTSNITIEDDYNESNRFINFIEYSVKNSCLADLFIDILANVEKIENKKISMFILRQKYIYIRFLFQDDVIENNRFMRNIIYWLQEDEKLEEPVDIIGDRFYYLLKGYKKEKSLGHTTMIEGAWFFGNYHLLRVKNDNNISDLNIEDYKSFVEEMKKYIKQGIPFVEIVTKKY